MPEKRYDITFTGRVQGVGFRFTAMRVARDFDVAGWVRNEPDGSVRCMVEGEPEQLDSFVKAVQDRMAGNISETRVESSDAIGEFSGFTIR